MSTKEQTLSLLAELPEDSLAWRELHDDARLLRDIAAAEEDVRNGRERPLAAARELLEQKWRHKAANGFDQLDQGDSVELDRDAFMNHFRSRRQVA
ncbi:hypothetical protein [Prosthecobacter vanneervenii]|uniref:Uncharacterized protein n=1 Tax=Prosthecobacter vanneervenii TaxID=48466 RepID=A0A7W7YAJ0_9BACT|nr:hypothetical protein [Prosthecobacter vanneervenii]MBB5032653.1 hypothetical protein [Prosthecobacter vanneervenii]